MRDQYSEPIQVRPYQILCTVCAAEAEAPEPGPAGLLAAIREFPDRPVQLVCDVGGVYAWQTPGEDDDPDALRRCELRILQRLDLPPGAILPARTLLYRVLKAIPTIEGICDPEMVDCAGNYEACVARGISAIIPERDPQEALAEKERSMEALRTAERVTTRPHLLMCSVCQYGKGTRPPMANDNLPELLQIILTERPDLPVTLVRGADWMMCAPCPRRVPELNACVNVAGSGGLSNELRDLDLLELLGLHYGDTLPARELYLLLLDRVHLTTPVCARDNPGLSVWWDNCGARDHADAQGNANYRKGREELLLLLKGEANA
jgi:hypothetical protein